MYDIFKYVDRGHGFQLNVFIFLLRRKYLKNVNRALHAL